ncbi:hypothetical protein MLD38_029795 [Melastoma candidum]|uniref:Uncharacterized protein n=1 Tax=Melastoma candidum TaxID=119954 RepID=A0ACB9N8X2_9MYRT|nr:hypothetical protein MLD38_029795 [Melastoma candidum]
MSFLLSVVKPPRGNLSISLITVTICAAAFLGLYYTEKATSLSAVSVFKFAACSRKSALPRFQAAMEERKGVREMDDRFEFDAEGCSVIKGKWVFNSLIEPLYSDRTCPYLEKQVTCTKNGRPDSDYLRWEWEQDDCFLPKFSPKGVLKKLRGKRLMFIGDSIQRGQWMSFVCTVESVIADNEKSMVKYNRSSHFVFTAKEYNATIEYYWAPFLVESNTDRKIIADPTQRIVRVDSISRHADSWKSADILVFNSYVWWMSGLTINSLWGSFPNAEEGAQELERTSAYTIALKTWANWIDTSIDPNRTRVFFTTSSPTHMWSGDWNRKNGLNCYNETRPVAKVKRVWGGDKMMEVAANVVRKMRVPVTFINVTGLSELRVDAHTSVYGETRGKLLTAKQKADPLRNADCIHWCLPGVPDTWNRILYAYL